MTQKKPPLQTTAKRFDLACMIARGWLQVTDHPLDGVVIDNPLEGVAIVPVGADISAVSPTVAVIYCEEFAPGDRVQFMITRNKIKANP
jgi:hypothetical protein